MVVSRGSSSVEQVAIGTATLVVALLGYIMLPQLDDTLAPAVGAAVALVLGMGAFLVARAHPSFGALGRGYVWTLWVAPVAWFAASAALLRLTGGGTGLAVAALATALLGIILAAQQRELQLAAGTRRGAEFLVSLAVFVSAFALFGLLYEQRALGWPVALAAAALAAVLATVPLRRAAVDEQRTALYAALVGLVVGQVAWALTYWTATAIVGGAFLLLLFYVLVGISEAVLDRSFGRRVLLEYGVVGACGLVLIVGAGPWHV